MLKLYNTLTRKKEEFKPLKKGFVSMYNCGPTVYDFIHIGNVRSFLFADTLRRYLEYKGFDVKQIMNITDVGHLTEDEIEAGEDKIEKKAKEKKTTPQEIAKFYEKDFFIQIKKLNFEKADKYPRATDYINEMIELIKKLIDKKHAYVANGSVYYDISTFKDYGKLSGNTIEKLEEGKGGRAGDNPDKRHSYDFALWIHDPKHIMKWESPWGVGYPGWHLECSVMSEKLLGKTIDIHTGGEDNKFPHHEAEIAQSEGANSQKFVNYWLHPRFLLVNGKKMAKRDGTFLTPLDIYKKNYTPQQLRFFFVSTHYQTQVNFTFEALDSSSKALKKILDFENQLEFITQKSKIDVQKELDSLRNDFEKAMDEDINTPNALAVIFDFIRKFNKEIAENNIGNADVAKISKQFDEFNKVFGILKTQKIAISEAIKGLLESREQARNKKHWDKADKIRKKIRELGYDVQDTEKGPKIIKWREK